MKRSTLTLSILTALLVSACGGSSSNDEQTKDPTPPKVTPTKPSTPSTGHTSTTGNKGNAGSSGSSAGSSASSSSSSDPTPPISSGSAPSGGKPIVIMSKTKIDEPPTPDENYQEKTLKELAAKIAAAKKALEASKKADEEAFSKLRAQIDQKNYTGAANNAWTNHEKIRDEFTAATSLGLNVDHYKKNGSGKSMVGPETLALVLESKKDSLGDKYDTWQQKLKKYRQAITRWEEENVKIPALTETAKEKKEEHLADKKKLAELQVQEGLANAMGIKSEEDYYNAKKNEVELESKFDAKDAEVYRLELDLDQTKREIGDLEFVLDDLELAVKEGNISDEKKGKFKDRIATLSKQVNDKKAEKTKLESSKAAAESARKTAEQAFKTAQKVADDLKDALKYRGVAAEGDFSKKSFAKISKVAHSGTSGTDEKWTLTFADNSTFEINVDKTGAKTIKRGAETYGSFENDSQGLIAYQKSGTNGKSIYGYIADQFYSVGEVTDPDYFNKPDALSYAAYKGKALLQADAAKGGSGLVADFEASVDFKEGKLKGNFSKFGAYDRSSTANVRTTSLPKNLREDLGKEIGFHAAIKGNKFMTEKALDNEASVYGYFYGDKVSEMGGLVEYKDLFHGSFGGAKQVD